MSLHWLKSAIGAAKKKNDPDGSLIVYLTGNEDKAVENNPKATKRSSRTTISDPENVIPQRAKVDKTPSLKQALTKIDSIGKTSAEDEVSEKVDSVREEGLARNKFTQEELKAKWDEIVEGLKSKEIRMYAALKSVQPVIKENELVEIYFQNAGQLEEFQLRLKPQIQSNLREVLSNHYIELECSVPEAEKIERPKLLSDKEKFRKMMEKNPALLDLKNKFKLDFD